MPRGDGTGPNGMGSMTGRAAGYCAGYSVPGYMNPIGGRLGLGFGWGRGRGRGFAWRRQTGVSGINPYIPYATDIKPDIPYTPYYSEEKELDLLKNQAQLIQNQLKSINNRISELETKDKGKKE